MLVDAPSMQEEFTVISIQDKHGLVRYPWYKHKPVVYNAGSIYAYMYLCPSIPTHEKVLRYNTLHNSDT